MAKSELDAAGAAPSNTHEEIEGTMQRTNLHEEDESSRVHRAGRIALHAIRSRISGRWLRSSGSRRPPVGGTERASIRSSARASSGEPVGVIEELGSSVKGYREGQRVIAGAITSIRVGDNGRSLRTSVDRVMRDCRRAAPDHHFGRRRGGKHGHVTPPWPINASASRRSTRSFRPSSPIPEPLNAARQAGF